MVLQLPALEAKEKKTFHLHLTYSFLEGIIAGVLALNEFVFIKSLHGTSYQLGFLFQFSMLVFLFLLLFNEFLRRIRDKKKMLRITAILTRAPLLLLLFFPKSSDSISGDSIYHYIFLGIFLVYYLAHPIIFPTINLFLKNTYEHQNFGKLYSYATSLNKIVMMLTTFLYGLLLDYNNFAFTYVFPVVAVLGMLSVYLLSRIDYRESSPPLIRRKFFDAVSDSAKKMFFIVRDNVPYRHFEIGFMLYGFAFMMTVTVIVLFFERALHLNYSSVAFYKNAYNLLAILLLPFFGRLLGKIDPRKFGIITFSSMLMYVFFLMMTEYFPYFTHFWEVKLYYSLIFYVVFHGVFAATMSLLWFIGSAYFCSKEEAGDYQSVHLFLTGFRAIFAPLIGVLFYELMGFSFTFSLAIFCLLLAISIMYWSYKREKKYKEREM